MKIQLSHLQRSLLRSKGSQLYAKLSTPEHQYGNRSLYNIWLRKSAGILSTWGDRGLLETQASFERANKILLPGIHSGLWQMNGSSEGTGVIQGETGLCNFRERAGRTTAKVPVLNASPARLMKTIFPRSSPPPIIMGATVAPS